jgi:LysM repeat protein
MAMARPNPASRWRATLVGALVPIVLLISGCTITVGSVAPTPTTGPGEPTNTPILQVQFDITPVASPTPVPPTATGVAGSGGGGGSVTTGATANYTIKPGDTLSGIALQYGITIEDLVKLNNIADPNAIQAGQVIKVPAKGPAPAPTATRAP